MSLYGSATECALHCLLYLADPPEGGTPSSRDLAEFQGVSPSYVAKLFTRLEKDGLVESAEGLGGGFRLARPAGKITVLDVVDAVEGGKPLFRCREIRRNCVLYGDTPPRSATHGTCAIHAVMLDAERRMREALKASTLADISGTVADKLSAEFLDQTKGWFQRRREERRRSAGRKPRSKELET